MTWITYDRLPMEHGELILKIMQDNYLLDDLIIKIKGQLESKQNTDSNLSKSYNFLGQAYLGKQLLQDALQFFQLMLKEIDKEGSENQAKKAPIYGNIGSVYKSQ